MQIARRGKGSIDGILIINQITINIMFDDEVRGIEPSIS
jgi:hypothetical protein